jgi:hypothetical protein
MNMSCFLRNNEVIVPLLSRKQVLNLKLSSIPKKRLKTLALSFSVIAKGSAADIIKELLEIQLDEQRVNQFIKDEYAKQIEERRARISDEDLRTELNKVNDFSWGVVQGQLDQKIQTQYVRRIVSYEDLISNVASELHDEITNYVICTWFNHWTTVLIEEHISSHRRVIPTIKNIKGVDIFFDGQPFDLKITPLPRDYDPNAALLNPKDLAVWMYENQGAQRFGSDNRLFVVLLNKENPAMSWELKRDFDLVSAAIDGFFSKERVSSEDEIAFTFAKKTYTALSKVLFIAR